MMVDGILQGKRGNKKFTAATIGAIASSVILNSLLVSLVYAARDDDEDETYLEKYLASLTSELLDGFNPLTYIPIVKDAWSILQGFDVERSDMTLVTNLVDSLQQVVKVLAKDTEDMDEDELAEHRKEVSEAVLSIVDNATSLVGVPIKNIRRDIDAVINTIKTIGRGDKTTKGSLKDAVQSSMQNATPVWGWLPDESKSDKLYDAMLSGDDEYVQRFENSYETSKDFTSAVKSALRKGYAEGTISRSEALDLLEEYGDIGGDDAYWMMKEWDYYAENGDMEGYSKYTDFHKAVETGKNLKTVINEYTAHGVEPKTLASQITSYFKPLYIQMTNAERASIKGYLLNAYTLLGYDRTKKSKDIDKWLEE
jgi:hypothetical protein